MSVRWPESVQTAPRRCGVTSGLVRGAQGGLFEALAFEELAGLFEVEEVAVHVELVDASVVGYGEDTIDFMAALAQGIDDKLDVYVIHGCQYRGNRLAGRE